MSSVLKSVRLTGILLVSLEHLGDLLTNFTVGKLDILLHGTVIVHELKEAIVGDVKL